MAVKCACERPGEADGEMQETWPARGTLEIPRVSRALVASHEFERRASCT